jgi:cystathionine beta-lyase
MNTDKFNFDLPVNRLGTDSIKYNYAHYGKPAGAIPMWVADMDFRAPQEVCDAVARCAAHGVFGYSEPGPAYYDALFNWYKTRHGWDPSRQQVTILPSVVFALSAAVRAFTKEGDGIIICQPVYHPFEHAITLNNRKLIINKLAAGNGVYKPDFDAFERQIKQNAVKLFILCSPHNPVGRVWTREELLRMAQICLKHGVTIVSDEIHCDFVFAPHKHTATASLGESIADITVTCTSPTKTFNIAGLQVSHVFIQNPKLNEAFRAECGKTGYGNPSITGIAAAQAAYSHGGPWLDALLNYLRGNVECLRKGLKNTNGLIKLTEPQGTYLMWLDCKALKLTGEELENFFISKAGLWLSPGQIFGLGGEGFMRMNLACPRATVERAAENLKAAI